MQTQKKNMGDATHPRAPTYLPGDVCRGYPESVGGELGHRGLRVVAAVHEDIRGVDQVPHDHELSARVDDLGLLGVRAEVEIVAPLRRGVGGPVRHEGGVAHARLCLRHGGTVGLLGVAALSVLRGSFHGFHGETRPKIWLQQGSSV